MNNEGCYHERCQGRPGGDWRIYPPHSPIRAITFVDELLDRCATLADMPRAFPLVPRYERHRIRRCVHRDYLIFYRVLKESVEVIHILHGARNYDALLFPDESPNDSSKDE